MFLTFTKAAWNLMVILIGLDIYLQTPAIGRSVVTAVAGSFASAVPGVEYWCLQSNLLTCVELQDWRRGCSKCHQNPQD